MTKESRLMNSSSTIASAIQLAGDLIVLLEELLSNGTAGGELGTRMALLLVHLHQVDSAVKDAPVDPQLDSALQKLMALLLSTKKFVLYAAESINEGMEEGLDVRFHAFAAKTRIAIEDVTTIYERMKEQNKDRNGELVEQPALEDICDDRALISQGAFGAIYRMLDTNDGRVYAVKRIRLSSLTGRGVTLAALAQECAELQALPQSPIGYCLQTFLSKGDRYFNIVMELIEGSTLAEKITCAISPTEDVILDWTKQVTSALHHIHGKGVLHRNLTPENVMLTAAGEAKIVGLKPHSLIDAGGVQCGAYTSYERAKGWQYDGRDDVWALGCIVLELLIRTRYEQALKSLALTPPDRSVLDIHPQDYHRLLRASCRGGVSRAACGNCQHRLSPPRG
jgi:hypothetical protein